MRKIISSILSSTKEIALLAIIPLLLLQWASTPSSPVKEENIAPSVVKLLNQEQTGGGTGFFAYSGKRKKTVIVTNDHVCQMGNNGYITVQDDNGIVSLNRILNTDPIRDLCIVETTRGRPLAIAADSVSRFQPVRGIGFASLLPMSATSGYYTGNFLGTFLEAPADNGKCRPGATEESIPTFFGNIDACLRKIELSATTIPSGPGASGSPVINSDGEVVGVVNSGNNLGRANFIPLPYLKEILERQ